MSEEEEENNKNKEQNNNEEEIEIKDTKEIDLMQKMKEIEQAIIFSWQRDTDRVKEIIECHEFLTQLINNNYTVNDIESKFFNNNEEYFTYFIRDFSLNTSKYLLYQNHVYGENGEEKAFTYTDPEGEEKTITQTYWKHLRPKERERIIREFIEQNPEAAQKWLTSLPDRKK